MRLKNLIGKTVIDSAGDDLGKLDDIEFMWEDKTISYLVIKGAPEIKQKVMSSKYGAQLMKKIGAKAEPDLVIPVSDVQSIGDVITLAVDIT